uniref:Secreted protein n=1 Tax=Anguilla anguilla TaxID=7936 RepID=A0A0E9WFQ4_ANGAN
MDVLWMLSVWMLSECSGCGCSVNAWRQYVLFFQWHLRLLHYCVSACLSLSNPVWAKIITTALYTAGLRNVLHFLCKAFHGLSCINFIIQLP